MNTDLTVDAEHKEHNEEQEGPQMRDRERRQYFRIYDKCQTKTCKLYRKEVFRVILNPKRANITLLQNISFAGEFILS